MGLESLVFKVSDVTVYDPEQLLSGQPKTITVLNNGLDDIVGLGLYVWPSTTLGDVDYPSDQPPETDYQDVIKWGEETVHGVAVSGGLQVTVPTDAGDVTTYITRDTGSTYNNRIRTVDLPAGSEIDIVYQVATPPAVSARRLHISVVFDID